MCEIENYTQNQSSGTDKATPMRVLHFVDGLSTTSGVMSVLICYYRNMDRTAIQFDFLYFDDSECSLESDICALGGRCYRLPRPSFSKECYRQYQQFFEVHNSEYSILHCHPIFAGALLGRLARSCGIKHVIQHSHSTKFGCRPSSVVRNYCLAQLNPWCVTEYAACSQAAAKLLGPKRAWKNKLYIMQNAIDCARFSFSEQARQSIRSKYGIESSTVVIGHTGRFSPEKNHEYLVVVFAEYHRINENSVLMLVGDGPERERIEDKCRDLGVEDAVIFTGSQKNAENYLSAMDLFLFPSLYEGLTLSLLEAQYSGLICFVADSVPKQAFISKRLYPFSLNSSPETVAQDLMRADLDYDRYQQCEELEGSCYDIRTCSKKLEQYYKGLR